MRGLSLSIGLSLTALRHSGASAPALVLSASSILESATSGTTVGALSVINHPSGSSGWTFTETADPDSKFAVSGANLNTAAALNYDVATGGKTSHSVTITASKSGQTDIPGTFTINVTNVLEVTLGALTLSADDWETGSATSGTIDGDTSGSALSVSGSLPAGLTIDTTARTWAWDGTGSVSTGSFDLVESHTDGSNSPRTSTINWTIAEAGATPNTPGLELATEPGEYPPELYIDTDETHEAGMTAVLRVSETSDFASYTDYNHVITEAEAIAGTFSFGSALSSITSGEWHFKVSIGGSAFSDPVSIVPDTTAPTLSSASDSADGATGYDGSVSTDEGNGTLYWYVSTSATPPTAANLKAGSGAVASGNQAVSGTGVQNVSGSGLTASTAYYIHYLHRDAAGNDSAIVSGDGFTTTSSGSSSVEFVPTSSTAPTPVNDAGTVKTFSGLTFEAGTALIFVSPLSDVDVSQVRLSDGAGGWITATARNHEIQSWNRIMLFTCPTAGGVNLTVEVTMASGGDWMGIAAGTLKNADTEAPIDVGYNDSGYSWFPAGTAKDGDRPVTLSATGLGIKACVPPNYDPVNLGHPDGATVVSSSWKIVLATFNFNGDPAIQNIGATPENAEMIYAWWEA